MNTAITVAGIVPTPPSRLVPPMITAAIDPMSSFVCPVDTSTLLKREKSTMPAMPAIIPLSR